MCINIGSLVGQIGMVYCEKYVGFWLAFMLPTVLFVFAPIVLAVCKKHYILLPCATLPRTQTTKQQKENLHPLTSRGLDLLWRTLSTHLACDSGVSLCSTGSVLRLLSLLCALGSSSLLLALLDSSLTGGGTGFWSLTATLLDHIEGGTDNSTLRLDGTAGSLLGNFLRDTLLVLSAEQDSPGNSAGVLAL